MVEPVWLVAGPVAALLPWQGAVWAPAGEKRVAVAGGWQMAPVLVSRV